MKILIYKYLNNSIIAIHCKWDDWVIGECSKICGTGTRNNSRTKLIAEENGGKCSGKPSEIEQCNTRNCPGMYQGYNFLVQAK